MKKHFLFLILLLCPVFVFAADKVDINTAPLQQLEEIIGIGPALAQRIIDSRPFSSVDDLLKVKGIGEKTLQKIKDQGLAYVEGQTQQATQEIKATPTPTPEALTPNATPALSPAPEITYPSGVFINEILPAPEGADDANEYIEIYNSNTDAVDISSWKLQDLQGTPATYAFPENTNISGNGYLVLKRPETKITLNNDEDGLNLVLPNDKTIDSVSYTKAPTNQSYNKINSNWQWSTTLTPDAKNTITAVIKPAKSTKKSTKALPNDQKIDNKYLSAISNPADSVSDNLKTEGELNPYFLFLIALAITIISGTIVLIIKLKYLKKSSL